MSSITKSDIEKGMSFHQYIELINTLLAEGKTTGPNQSESMANYARLNAQRMDRIHKTTTLEPDLLQAVQYMKPQHWVVLTEGWCGDAANSVPVMDLVAKASEGKIQLTILLRDENLSVMDQYLTDGSRSIPKLIVLDAETMQELQVWGPRPDPAQRLMMEHKANPVEGRDVYRDLQQWYNEDKTHTMQHEWLGFLR